MPGYGQIEVNETCGCGAEFSLTVNTVWVEKAEEELERFREAHESCRESGFEVDLPDPPEGPPPPPHYSPPPYMGYGGIEAPDIGTPYQAS